MDEMQEKTGKKKKKWPWILGACAAVAVAAAAMLILFRQPQLFTAPTLTVETPQKRDASDREPFLLDVTVSELGEDRYPAMSLSLGFDPSRLEFLGVQEGNVFILDDALDRKLPDWNCNVENSNATGRINIMYLDMTGGKNAFTKELLEEDGNVVLRLQFRLRGSVRPGDVLELTVEDAVFAASDETRSLASAAGTLKTKNGRLVIGE